LTPSTAYSVVVTGNCSGGATANSTAYSFTTQALPPSNDECAGAIGLTPGAPGATCTAATTGSTVAATASTVPGTTCAGTADDDVWYSFVATSTVHTITVVGNSSFDAVISLRSGACPGTLVTGTCTDATAGGSAETLTVSGLTVGANYYVRVYSYSSTAPTTTAAGGFTICVTTPADLTVSTVQNIPAGMYNNITILNGGNGTLVGTTTVYGTLNVLNGGTLTTACQTLTGPGNFNLQTGGTLAICNTAGITTTGATGAVQLTGTRTYASDANYIYNGTSAQVTGTGLPAQVLSLTKTGTVALTLSQPVAVMREVRITGSGNIVTTAANTLTLLSTPSGTALVANTSTGVVSGPGGVMQRAIFVGAGIAYRHYSSPVASTTIADLTTPTYTPVVNPAYNTAAAPNLISPFPTVFGYDETRIASTTSTYNGFDKGWFSPSALTDVMQPNRGYSANVPASALVDFVGTFNNGTQNSGSLTRGTDPGAGWHLLGNPYPAPLDWSTVTAAQLPGMDGAMYVFESTSQYGGFYRTYVNGVGSQPLINAGQGYFVRVSTPGSTGSVNLTNANRVTTFGPQPGFGRGTVDTRPTLRLQLLGSTGADDAYVYFDGAATAAVDAAHDAVKLANPSGYNLATLVGNTELAINGLPTLAGSRDVVLPLTLRVPQAGSFTLTAADLARFGSATVYLRDAQTGTEQALTAGASYRFTLAGTSTTRFSLVFRPTGVTATQASLTAEQVSLYPNPAQGRFTLLLPPVAGQKEVKATLLNALGQVVLTRSIALTPAGANSEFNTQALAKGVYVLRLQAGAQLITQRVVVE